MRKFFIFLYTDVLSISLNYFPPIRGYFHCKFGKTSRIGEFPRSETKCPTVEYLKHVYLLSIMKTSCYLCTPVVFILTEYRCHAIGSIIKDPILDNIGSLVLWNSTQRLKTKEMCRLADIIIQEKFFKKECLGQLRFEKWC